MTLNTEQQRARSKGIGGSDVAALLGLSKWKTPVQLWAEKRGELPPETPGNPEAIHFGHVLEGIVADEFSRRTEIKVRRDRLHYQHPDHEFMLANIDRRCIGLEDRAGLECKTGHFFTGKDWGETGTDEVPFWYFAQAAHYMSVLRFDRMFVAVLIGGSDFRYYELKRDEKMIDNLIRREAEFWQHVVDGTPPEPIADADLKILYPEDNGEPIIATHEIAEKVVEIDNLKAQKKALEDKIKAGTLEVQSWMGENAEIVLGPGGDKLATWKSHETKRLDSKRLKAEKPDVWAEYSVTSTVRPFRLS